MSNHIEPQANGTSPFDTIKNITPAGEERWSARDLMGLMAYTRWNEFKNPIDRAMATAKNQGMDVENLFRRSAEKTGGRPREDYNLNRYAAYLVAMNGDPNIPEVAAAQHYFAVRTREAETRPTVDAASLTRLELLQIAMNAETERMELEAKNLELEPKAEAYDSFLSADGDYSIGAVAKMLGKSQNKMFDLLRSSGVFIAKGAMRNTPYQQYMHHFSVRAHEYERQDGTRGTSYTTKVQPSGIDFLRKKLGLSLV
ncbi:phage antirepressor KilAC domain-containing protein [Corynebacterium glutamicum]|uniref:phage antirepressor KilAC domain-containing protein n=1 Tax=Corynebacterium glutamicum TaxID=1718 RepID=UPI000744C96D|nr:phage antirepressor KilAC domain-containing protein [Corynebacterium glutamicum]AMA00247.1 hypothetical protein APT58_08415 [Corynebacterium glutamicum]